MTDSDEFVDLIDDRHGAGGPPGDGTPGWRVLIVDDEREVHSATRFALKDLIVAARPLEFLHAYSASEARALMASTPGIAVVLLDVVMERGNAGLELVRAIREELGLADTRIILRTGQPGYAPELEVIRDYDINDYKTKAEMTHTRLATSLTTASAPTSRSAWCWIANRASTASCAPRRRCWHGAISTASPRTPCG
jgi:CheY-like chemotaxis protein